MQSRSGPPAAATSELANVEGAAATRYAFKDAGVDWLTVTCRPGESSDLFDEVGYSLLHVESDAGAHLKPWRFEGFEGLNAGHVAFGHSESMAIMRLSSTVAHDHWRRACELATNCSRIDFQFTVRNVADPNALILNAHKEAVAFADSLRRPTEVDLRLSNRRGPTLYLGVRTSARFGRMYDKFRESKLDHYRGCVRAELQANGKAANFAARALLQRPRSPDSCIPYVAAFFDRRGVSPYWPDVALHDFTVPRSRGSAAKRLEWLRSQVRPAVKHLVEHGYGEEVVESLGLRDHFDFDV